MVARRPARARARIRDCTICDSNVRCTIALLDSIHASIRCVAAAPRRAQRRRARARGDWATIRTLLPYLWEYKGRVLAALACLVAREGRERRRAAGAEGDRRQPRSRTPRCSRCRSRCSSRTASCALSTTVFTELREFLFAKVTQRAVRKIALQGVPPSACAVAALPSGAPDRRPHARRRARPARHLHADQLRAVLDPADAGRDRAGLRRS